jgi:hypothetical protein
MFSNLLSFLIDASSQPETYLGLTLYPVLLRIFKIITGLAAALIILEKLILVVRFTGKVVIFVTSWFFSKTPRLHPHKNKLLASVPLFIIISIGMMLTGCGSRSVSDNYTDSKGNTTVLKRVEVRSSHTCEGYVQMLRDETTSCNASSDLLSTDSGNLEEMEQGKVSSSSLTNDSSTEPDFVLQALQDLSGSKTIPKFSSTKNSAKISTSSRIGFNNDDSSFNIFNRFDEDHGISCSTEKIRSLTLSCVRGELRDKMSYNPFNIFKGVD